MQGVSESDFDEFCTSVRNEDDNNVELTGVSRSSTNSIDNMLGTITALLQQNATMLSMLQKNKEEDVKYNVMPDLSKSIEDFSGDEGSSIAERWLKNLEITSKLHSWPDAFIYQTAKMHIVGSAKFWLSSKHEIRDWNSFKAAFSKTFIFKKSKTEEWKAMQMCIQKSKEKVSAYLLEKISLCKALGLDFKEIKEQVAIGLYAKELSTYIISTEHVDEDDLYQDVMAYERIYNERRNRVIEEKIHEAKKVKTPTSNRISNPSDNNVYTGTVPKVEKKLPPKNEKGEVKCFNCNEYGHLARSCRNEKKEVTCYRCGNTGHIAKRCEKPKQMDNAVMGIKANEHHIRNSLKYVKTVVLNNQKYAGLIDTGSSDCTIKATLALMGNVQIIKNIVELKGFGNNIVKSSGEIYADIKVDEVSAESIKIMIVPDDAQPTDVIIGRSFTDLENIVYFRIDDKLEFKYRKHFQLPYNPDIESEITDRANVVGDCELLPNSVHFISSVVCKQNIYLPVVNMNSDKQLIKKDEMIDKNILITTAEIVKPGKDKEPVKIEEINADNDITDEQKEEVVQLLNEFRSCVAKNIYEVGKTDVLEMKIEVNPDDKPISCKPYKTNNEERQKIKEIVDEWKSAGIVEETNSSYASPVLLVKKKTGESRMVVDYRKLNAQTKKINFPLQNLDEHMELLRGSKIFAILDLAHGYLQMPLAEDAKEKTAFITPDDTGQFTRAMFGLMNAPFYFSKLMQTVLEPLRDKIVIFYLDDMLIPAEDWSDLMMRLRQVLEQLQEAKLTIKLSKCEFGKRRIEYLGYIISNAGIEPGDRKLEAIRCFPRPCDVHDVRRFWGLASFFRRFVEHFAAKGEPLTRLLRKNVEFKWESDQERAFQRIKAELLEHPILKVYDPNAKRSELHTDASANGLGALFLQSDEDNQLHPVYAISRRTTDTERNYHSSKLELMAIVWAIERLRIFLINIKFVVVTDCQALTYLNKNKTKNAQIIRWCNTLGEYDFEVKFRSGQSMKHVDALSRAPVEVPEQDLEDTMVERLSAYTVLTREGEILLFQCTDSILRRKIDLLKRNKTNISANEKSEIKDYILENGLLYKIVRDGDNVKTLYAVPKSMRKTLVIKYHDLNGHIGVEKSVKKISEYYYFPAMKNYVKRHIRMCIRCIMAKSRVGKQPGFLHPIPPGNRPFAIVHTDHLGPFVTSARGNKYVLIIIDNFTKFVQLEAVKTTRSEVTVSRFERFIQQFGAPERIISDRGTSFTSTRFQKMCENHGIKHTLNSSRHPQANGLVERLNSTLLSMMQTTVEDPESRDWDKMLKRLERIINTSVNKTTNRTPFELLYGYLPRFDEDIVRELTRPNEKYRLPSELRKEVRNNIEVEQKRYKDRYDKHRLNGITYSVGDIVYMKAAIRSTGESTKLQARYRGPYTVVEVLPSDTYRISSLTRSNAKTTTAHVSQIKIWKNYHEDEEGDPSEDEAVDQGLGPHEAGVQETEAEPKRRVSRRPKYLSDYELNI